MADATVELVRSKAAELGFVPDPMLVALAAYRKQSRPEPYHANIAWVSNHSRTESMDQFPAFEDYWQGATERARELGYRLDPFWLESDVSSLRSLERVLASRGIRALIAAPQSTPGRPLDLHWERYAAVGIGYTVQEPLLDRVTNDHFASMTDLYEALRLRGYHRVGCYLWEVDNDRMGKRARSAFHSVSRETKTPVETYELFEPESFLEWVKQHRLDAVICRGASQLRTLLDAGIRIPEDLGVAGYALESDEPTISGMAHNNRRIGATAVEWVSNKLQRSQLGLQEGPQRLLISSKWLEKTTLRSE